MGSTRFTPTDWDTFTTSTTAGRSTDAVFTSSGMVPELDPKNIRVRESRDSDVNPASNAIIIGLDVTGSMGLLADVMVRTGLPTLFTEIYERKPVSDPHIMFMGIGDVICDKAPLQVSQFEGGIEIAGQLAKLYLEHGGGANNNESYTLAWYFAAMYTSIDCFEKRGRKGYLFTVGDEEPPPALTGRQLAQVFGGGQGDLETAQLLDMVTRAYHVFHVIVEEGSYASRHMDRTMAAWTGLLGQRALRLSDHRRLSEVIVSAIEVTEGRDRDMVAASWSGDTSLVVAHALGDLVRTDGSGTPDGGIVAF